MKNQFSLEIDEVSATENYEHILKIAKNQQYVIKIILNLRERI